MLIPKRTKYRYNHSLRYDKGLAKGNNKLNHGEYGLVAQEGAYISNRVIEAGRKVISPHVKKVGKIRINIYPSLGKTKKPLEVRMGSGKGSVEGWFAVVKKGTVIYEISGLNRELSLKVLKKVAYKFPIKCKVIEREQVEVA